MTEHLSQEIIEQYRQRSLPAAELIAADDHLAACAECRQRLDAAYPAQAVQSVSSSFVRELREAAAARPEHLRYEQLAAYVDKELDGADRELVESHLSHCQRCAEEMTELRAFAAELSVYPDKQYAPAAEPKLLEKAGAASLVQWWQSFWQSASLAFSLRAAAVAALVVVLALAATLLWRNRNSAPQLAGRDTPTPAPATPSPGAQPNTPDNSSSPAPVLLALNDGGGRIVLDSAGNLTGAESFSAADQQRIITALRTRRAGVPASLGDIISSSSPTMGGGSEEKFAVISPVGIVITKDRPVLRWEPLRGAESYRVEISDIEARYREVAASPTLTATEWKVDRALPRGRNYSWQVIAVKEGKEVKAPSGDQAEPKFRVLEKSKLSEIERVRKASPKSHLALGLLYAQAGLLDEAEAEFRALTAANPQSAEARSLLRDVQSKRRAK
jgi:hypothetical protein